MSPNFGTFITIVVILFVVIVVDGLRRMLSDLREQKKAKKFIKHDALSSDKEYDNPELPNGGQARVLKAVGTTSKPIVPPATKEASVEQPEVEQVQLAAEAQLAKPEQHVPQPTGKSVPKRAVTNGAIERIFSNAKEMVPVRLVAPKGFTIAGEAVEFLFNKYDLAYGEKDIFHALDKDNNLLFSVSNAYQPESFDLATIAQQDFLAFTFFMVLPGPSHPSQAMDHMLTTVNAMAKELGASLLDEHKSVLTGQTQEHLRERVREFERRAMLAKSANQ